MNKKEATKILDKNIKAQKENFKRIEYVNKNLLEAIENFLVSYDCDGAVIKKVKKVIKDIYRRNVI